MSQQHFIAILTHRKTSKARHRTPIAYPSRLRAVRAVLDWIDQHPGGDTSPQISTCAARPDGRSLYSDIRWHGASDMQAARAITIEGASA